MVALFLKFLSKVIKIGTMKIPKMKRWHCNKQHLSNIWDSVYQKVKQHWGWVEKSVA